MRKELDDKLCKDFPNLYKERSMKPQQTCMCWGFPGNGWYDLIRECSEILEPLGAVANQVKEKFGTLRFYYSLKSDSNSAHKAAAAAVDIAEEKSGETCEVCGKPAKTSNRSGWLCTECPSCLKAN